MSVRRRLCGWSAPVLLVVALVSTAAPARADDGSLQVDVPGDGRAFVHDVSTPLLHFHQLAPGVSASGTLVIRNDSSHAVVLNLRTTDPLESENGCLRQEVQAGDHTCSARGGELGDWLQVTVSRRAAGGDQPLWSGGLAALHRGADVLQRLSAHAALPLRVTVSLPFAAGNDTMSDSVAFGLRWTASSDLGDSTVAGPSVSAQSGAAPVLARSGFLPGTGDSLRLWMLVLDLLLLVVGGALVVILRRGRSHAHAARSH